MKQVNLGSQGLRVPAIGLGCMEMSDFYGSSSEAQNLCVLDRAMYRMRLKLGFLVGSKMSLGATCLRPKRPPA